MRERGAGDVVASQRPSTPEVLIAAHAADRARPASAGRALWLWAAFGLLFLALAFVHLHRLGEGHLRMWDEGLTAERGREMLETRDFLNTRMNYELDFRKPPLFYTLVAGAYAVLGETTFAARLWSNVFALGCVAMVGGLAAGARRDWWCGLWGAFLLGFAPLWVLETRQAYLDSAMIFFTLVCWWLLTSGRRVPGAAVWAGVAAAVATLMKGPLPGVVFLFVWMFRPARDRWRAPLTAAAVWVGLVAPWVVWQLLRHQQEFSEAVHFTFVARAMTRIHGLEMPWWWVPMKWATDGTATLLLAVAGTWWAVRRDPLAFRAALVPLLVGGCVFLGLVFMQTRMARYLVFFLPFAAWYAAVLWTRLMAQMPRAWAAPAGFALVLLTLVLFTARHRPVLDFDAGFYARAREAALLAQAGRLPVLTVDIPVQTVLCAVQRSVVETDLAGVAARRHGLAPGEAMVVVTRDCARRIRRDDDGRWHVEQSSPTP